MRLLGYNTAIYCRLSRDDGTEESQSIQSQKEILKEYVDKQGWNLVDYYIDDGYSGTNFNRPSFQRLINDIELGKIHIVITKDLSRLGRNYIQTGYYTEEYFPSKNIRYIAVNDRFDTFNEDNNDFIPFKNIINEWYAKDISKKIRFTLDNKAKLGEPIRRVFPIFGYAYNENNERIIDPETAPIVQTIFKKYIEYASSTKVAQYLTTQNIKIPSYYNAIKYNYNKEKILSLPEYELINWKPSSIRDILSNIEYTGAYITAKSKSISFKNKKRLENDNKYIFENKYPPIIDLNTYETANKILKRTRAGAIPIEENKYKGLIICANCGKTMVYDRKKNGSSQEFNYFRYCCKNKDCGSLTSINVDTLNNITSQIVLNLKQIIISKKEQFITFVTNYTTKDKTIITDYDKELIKYIEKNTELDNLIMTLFEQNARGLLPLSTYEIMINKYTKEKKYIEEQISDLNKQKNTNIKAEDKNKNALIFLNQIENIKTQEILSPKFLHYIFKQIQITTIPKLNQHRKATYEIKYYFEYLDDIIKEFIAQNEIQSRNLCTTI